MQISFRLNSVQVFVEAGAETPLLYVLLPPSDGLAARLVPLAGAHFSLP